MNVIPPNIITPKTITLVMEDGRPFQVPSTSALYNDLLEAIEDGDLEAIENVVNRSKEVADVLGQYDNVSVYRGHVEVDGISVSSYLVSRILNSANSGKSVDRLAKFLGNVMENPSRRAVQDLYRFVEESNLPITEDGCFLAFKAINPDYTDCRTGTIDNSVGAVVSMPRNNVDEDITRTCSYGLHACGPAYLGSAYGMNDQSKVVLVKINPRDVVAFPNDYHLQKLRCCRYEVYKEITGENVSTFFLNHDFIHDE